MHLLYLVTVTRTGSNPHGVVQRRANSQVASCQVSQLHSDSRHAATKQFTCQLGTKRMKHELANIARWCKMVQDGARWCKYQKKHVLHQYQSDQRGQLDSRHSTLGLSLEPSSVVPGGSCSIAASHVIAITDSGSFAPQNGGNSGEKKKKHDDLR